MTLPKPATKTLSREEFPEQAGWIDPLLRAINSISDALSTSIGQLNSAVATVELDLDIPATYANAFPKLINNPLGTRAKHVWATGVIKRTDPSATCTAETRAVFVECENAASSSGQLQLKIKNVAGLVASTNYRITLRVEA